MDPRKLSQLVPFLEQRGLSPKKSLSQNFLIDQNILEKIVITADIHPGEKVLEIGPGLGALTKTLLEKGASVKAIETDSRFIAILSDLFKNEDVTIVLADILNYPFMEERKIVSNIPYHITSPILEKITLHSAYCKEAFLTVQKDWAVRIASPEDKTALSYYVRYLYDVKVAFSIPAGSFWPRPHVESALLTLKRKENIAPAPSFYPFLQKLFQKKRKMLRGTLDISHLESFLHEMGLSLTMRPEELSPEELFLLHQEIEKSC